MKKEVSVNKDKNEVTILLGLRKRILARDPRMTVTTRMVQIMLENDNFMLDKCITSDRIDNHSANSKHEGSWTFSLIEKKSAKKQPKRTALEKQRVKKPPVQEKES